MSQQFQGEVPIFHIGYNYFNTSSCQSILADTRSNTFTLVVSQLRRLVAGFSVRRPGFEPGSGHEGFMVDEAALCQLFPCTSVSPAKNSTDCSTFIIIHYHPGLVQEASIGFSYNGLSSNPPPPPNVFKFQDILLHTPSEIQLFCNAQNITQE
jgi:hypothetical protein